MFSTTADVVEHIGNLRRLSAVSSGFPIKRDRSPSPDVLQLILKARVRDSKRVQSEKMLSLSFSRLEQVQLFAEATLQRAAVSDVLKQSKKTPTKKRTK
ncbi:Hypothetical protein, putative [Bodo saltans]|uniref:Uncharacterized protein n=1 Tax=Bodo saltans TaxID=75058 RepID=A0A0S4JPW3_BODSA|nr:Hypothetical protein, putative [Bodo saltans]|eukprot:CUG92730.1 Hypothetical protein, putative [Bodo saltans]